MECTAVSCVSGNRQLFILFSLLARPRWPSRQALDLVEAIHLDLVPAVHGHEQLRPAVPVHIRRLHAFHLAVESGVDGNVVRDVSPVVRIGGHRIVVGR